MDARNFFSAWIVGGGVGLIGLMALIVVEVLSSRLMQVRDGQGRFPLAHVHDGDSRVAPWRIRGTFRPPIPCLPDREAHQHLVRASVARR